MRVIDKYYIDEDEFHEKSQEDEYWEKAYKFYMDVRYKDEDELTDKQESWLIKIYDKLR